MAPLANDAPIVDNHQSRTAPYDSAQSGGVGMAERIFSSRHVLPSLYHLVAARRETVERHLVLAGIVVDAVDVVKLHVVRFIQIRRNEQHGVSLAVNHLVGDVLAIVASCNREVVYRRNISLRHLNRPAVYECPCGVGVVVESKLASLSVLLQYECCLKLRLLGSFGYLHTLANVGSHIIGAEVERRQDIQTVSRQGEDKQYGVVDYQPLSASAHQSRHFRRIAHQNCRSSRKNHILEECLPVAEHYRVAKASAVAHRIADGEPKGERRHHRH